MDSARNIIFITCLLSGICYSNAEGGAEFFKDPEGKIIQTPSEKQILRKIAENLICGDKNGWVSHFWKQTHPACPCNLKNPCGDNCRCVVNNELTDYTCEAEQGFLWNPVTKTCDAPKSLVTCKPGSRRVAADQLIVGKLDNYEWVSGIYERKAGLGYHNTDEEIYNHHKIHDKKGDTHIQRYFHDVPLKGREFYEQFKIDCATNKKTKELVATLSYNYEENHWQFKHVDKSATIDDKFTVTSRSSCASCSKICVEDVKSWTYTYSSKDSRGSAHFNIGRLFIEPAADKFQIRDTEAYQKSKLAPLNAQVQAIKCPSSNLTTINY